MVTGKRSFLLLFHINFMICIARAVDNNGVKVLTNYMLCGMQMKMYTYCI